MRKAKQWCSRARSRLVVGIFGCIAAFQPISSWGDWSTSNGSHLSELEISITSPFEAIPPGGVWPVNIEITNRSSDTRNFEFSVAMTSGGYRNKGETNFVQDLTVEPKKTGKYSFLVPVPDTEERTQLKSGYELPSATIKLVEGGGTIVREAIRIQGSHAHTTSPARYLVVSERWAGGGKGTVSDHFLKKKQLFYGAVISNVRGLPNDWRGYLGTSIVMLTGQDWEQLSSTQRGAIQQWIMMGGVLFSDLSPPTQTAELSAARCILDVCDLGSGNVVYVETPWISGVWDAADRSERDALKGAGRSDEKGSRLEWWRGIKLGENVPKIELPHSASGQGEKSILGLQFMVFLYAMIVGPVSVAYLTIKKRLMWLYVTTPAIAAGASLLIVISIVLRDGVGGTGQRWTQVFISARDKVELIQQLQTVTTGMILQRSFQVGEGVFLERRDAPTKSATNQSTWSEFTLVNEGSRYSGDWIKSKSDLQYGVSLSRSSRAGIQLTSNTLDEAPRIVSRLPVPISVLLLSDANGGYWYGKDIQLGQDTVLLPISSESDLRRIIDDNAKLGSATGVSLSSRNYLRRNRDVFVAISADASPYVIPTLNGISWTDHPTLIFGDLS